MPAPNRTRFADARPHPDVPYGREGRVLQPAAHAVGTPGADTIRADSGRDVIISLAGDDHITGLRGRDLVCAGPGADVIDDVGKSVSTKSGVHYTSAIKVDSGPGDDDVTVGTAWMIYAGSGDDDVTVTHSTLGAFLGAGDDHLTSTGWGVDGVHLGGGNDRVDNNSSEVEAIQRTVVHFARSTTDMRVDLVSGIAVSSAGNRERIRLHNVHGVVMGGGHNLVRGTPEMDTSKPVPEA